MHRLIEEHLEELLDGRKRMSVDSPVQQHLDQCVDCRSIVVAMREQSMLLQREFSLPLVAAEVEPAPGFYARVLERIEAQRPISVWDLFLDSMWGRRLATASLAIALVMVGYVVTMEAREDLPRLEASTEVLPGSDFAGEMFASTADARTASVPSGDAVFVSLVTYQHQ